jgi:hypothetical protein
MRPVLVVVAVAVLAAGCGSRGKTSDEQINAEMAKVETTCAEGINCAGDHFQPFRRCTHVSGGFRACTTFSELKDEQTGIYRRVGSRWVKVVDAAPGQRGWWRRMVASPDRSALLGQWSGECETQTTYIARGGGAPRPIFSQAQSRAVGWSDDGRARVRVLAASPDRRGDVQPGIYLVDPRTLAHILERSRGRGPAC